MSYIIYINGTCPKAYMIIKSNIDVNDMLNHSIESYKFEVVINVQAYKEVMTSQNTQTLNDN